MSTTTQAPTSSTSTPSSSSSPPGQTTEAINSNKLQPVNYANVVAFFVNLVVTFGSSQFLPDNAELSAKYQTLVTPAGYAFAIWGIIFTAELVWTVAQTLPSYRSNTLIIKGVGYNFVWACVAQAAWSILFGLERITLSLVSMVLILIPLVMAVTQMERLTTPNTTTATTTKDYWLLKFPIQIHTAWIMAATLVNSNVVLVASNVSATGQATAAMISLGIVLSVGLFYITKQLWVVPGVLAWATFAIASELQQPRDSIVATFTEKTIEQTRVTAMVVASTVVALAIAKILYSRIIGGGNRPSSSSVENETNTDYNPIS
mmetsp:Transcript_26332/g.62643  ORF Transcript_26332/g.62643 Transcript_26332/m.62643 type:complete len:318 (+) Transcript_26332:241-1194(+)